MIMKEICGLEQRRQALAICYPGNDYQHLTFDCYSIKDGLPNGVIQSIVEDQDNKMWIATEYGISRFTLATKQIENYYFSSHTLGMYTLKIRLA